ncbi:MAG TPA: prepilin peptidase [archaeon]|nr:prepilin peptidase [archaeon]HLD81329.1 prepilin peptidase [archaeon]
MFQLAFFASSLFFLLAAAFTDYKTRLIPNKLTFSMILLGALLTIANAWTQQSLSPLVFFLESVAVALLLALAFYKLGVWAGGDVKLLLGVAALNSFPANVFSSPYFQVVFPDLAVFPVTFVVYSVLSVFPFSVLYTIASIASSKKLQGLLYSEARPLLWSNAVAAAAVSPLALLSSRLGLGIIEGLALFVLFFFFYYRKPLKDHQLQVSLLLALLGAASFGASFAYSFAATLGLFLLVSLVFLVVKVMRSRVLRFEKKITQLVEGDIPAERITLEKSGSALKALREFVSVLSMARGLAAPQKSGVEVLADPFAAAGLEAKEIRKLKSLVRAGKLEDVIVVKKSLAFAPALVLGYLASAVFGDLVWLFLGFA